MGPHLQIATNTGHRLLVPSAQMFLRVGYLCTLAFDAVTTILVLKSLRSRSTGVRSGMVSHRSRLQLCCFYAGAVPVFWN